MAGNRKRVYPTSGKRRKSFYDFTRDYPGTGYDRNIRRSTSALRDSKKRIKIAAFVLSVLVIFALSYFITYTCLEISNEKITFSQGYLTSNDENKKVDDNDKNNLTKNERETTTKHTSDENTTTFSENQTNNIINE